jgi:hypothetical protein
MVTSLGIADNTTAPTGTQEQKATEVFGKTFLITMTFRGEFKL